MTDYDAGARKQIDRLERRVVRLEDAIMELHEWVTNPQGYKKAQPRVGAFGSIARRVSKREAGK